ncbi:MULTISPECIES: hypothetical protein [Chryseobacterium]|uniref:Uncharacterized protein n=1 Tax=Candidatus Chryseobacterium massiliense TaxID=204089 RepID=A0A3D9B2K0_9FLAO|nr:MULTISPECIES: hypothetical protein [Chryseobacterium]REC47855.1 hypothetical protein DRF68_12500 [Candidatus Chryseobacterium massiliae]
MRTFLAIGRKSGLKIVFKYDLNGVLKNVEFDGAWTDELIERIKVKIPPNAMYCHSQIKDQSPQSQWIFKEITDLSFETGFYKPYPNKLGKKSEALKAWNNLTDTSRMLAVLYLDVFIPLKRKEGTNIPYASSYLNGKYWES